MKKFCVLIFFVFLWKIIFSSGFGLFFGLEFSIGTFQRVGLALNFYYFAENYQFSARTDFHFVKKGIGVPFSYDEAQFNFAFIYGFINFQNHYKNLKYTYFQNFTNKKNALGYSLNFYIDQIGTTQRTGSILLQFKKVAIYTENDILAQKASDKYRTAALKISYIDKDFLFSVSTIMWTPNPKNVERKFDENYPARFGYKDLTKQKYGQYSTGILCAELQRDDYRFALGWESEWIRYFFQNKLIHDMYFFPKKWNKARNPHYPMTDCQGNAFLFKENQKVKPAKPFVYLGKNLSVFY